LRRRELIAGFAALLAGAPGTSRAAPSSEDLEAHALELEGDPRLARRSLLLVPKHVAKGTKLPLLVLLHGLGETNNEKLGIRAWSELYGLVRAYERLRHPPIQRLFEKKPYLSDERRRELDAELARRPLRGLVIACPVTPNPHRLGDPAKAIDRYADWLEKTLIPAAKKRAPVAEGAANTGLDGCSLGGYVGFEVFLRKPELFGTIGGVQSAFSVPAALRYAEAIKQAIARTGPRAIHIETSSQDPYRQANSALAKRLGELGIAHQLRIPPGPHDQPWLREIGSLEMLLWHDRELGKPR
jgi:hypothetical protein